MWIEKGILLIERGANIALKTEELHVKQRFGVDGIVVFVGGQFVWPPFGFKTR